MGVTPAGKQVAMGGRQWGRGAIVEVLTSARALAHAEELTSHRKEKATVVKKSWGEGRHGQFLGRGGLGEPQK